MPRFSVVAAIAVVMFTLCEWRGINLLPTPAFRSAPPAGYRSSGGFRTYQTGTGIGTGFHGGK
jgi:hypothetical protein